MTLAKRLTFYRITRDHADKTEFFWVNVPEASQYGFGFQLNCRGTLYGISLHTRAKESTA
jgi:hypothetical protein